MIGTTPEFQPKDRDTGERLATSGRVVAQGIRYTIAGEHETERAADLLVDLADAMEVIDKWPLAQKKVAEQMLERYGHRTRRHRRTF
jgi:hypothetical protein